MKRGECYSLPAGLSADAEAIPTAAFYPCLLQFLTENPFQASDIQFKDDRTIKGWRQSILPKKVDRIASEGPKYLDDIRDICDTYGVGDTYAYSD